MNQEDRAMQQPAHTTEAQVVGEIDARRIADAEAEAVRERESAAAPRKDRSKNTTTAAATPAADEAEEATP